MKNALAAATTIMFVSLLLAGGAFAQTKENPVVVGGDIPPPKRTKVVAPEYSEEARKAGVKGFVLLEVLITPKGLVDSAKVLKPLPLVTDAAVKAVLQWTYEPVQVDGKPVWARMVVTVRFPPTP